jgi:transposase
MNNTPQKQNHEEVSSYTILQRIKSGSVDAKALSKEQRQACIESLTLEGYKVSEVAHLLSRSEKTIKRDLQDIWKKNASMPTPDFVLREITEMIEKGKSNQAHLMRMARSETTSAKEKIEAEEKAWQIAKELSERLQSLGFLPSQPQRVVGEMYHYNTDKDVSTDDLKKQVIDITSLAKEHNIYDNAVDGKVKAINEKIEKLELKQDVDKIAKEIEDSTNIKEAQDE